MASEPRCVHVSKKDKLLALLFLSMTGQRVIVILGSEADYAFAVPIKSFLSRFGVSCEFRVASAHKEPKRLIQILEDYEKQDERTVYITVAGRSNALSGLVDFQTRHPVIACPPQSEDLWGTDIYSSLRMPKGVSLLVVCDPENAALAAIKILGENDSKLAAKVAQYRSELQSKNVTADSEIRHRQDG